MLEVFDINTGEVLVASQGCILRSQALGSCIAVVAFDQECKVGGIAHIMLPGRAAEGDLKPYRYCENAIDHLENLMCLTAGIDAVSAVCLVGAGNVLCDKNDTICSNNINSVCSYLRAKNIAIIASVLGGFTRKSAFLNLMTGAVEFSCGCGDKKKLLSSFQ